MPEFLFSEKFEFQFLKTTQGKELDDFIILPKFVKGKSYPLILIP